ncbi:hypothetical protein RJ640_024039 [Escallonia rubra]|uniref:Uncharacterized protein n=1 Tax=Escallonia rubra TaxID=112253 RepID=A0AA88UR73_9ASTE|nr:hypothetical protein RJ640_024039 [Escallonia rubra]
MGGKARKRREKNYRAAHGGHNPLPPPPAASSLDAVPYKLRKLMAFSSTSHHQQQQHQGSGKVTVDGAQRRKKEGIEKSLALLIGFILSVRVLWDVLDSDLRTCIDVHFRSQDASKSSTIGVNREHKGGREQHMDHDDGTLEKKKKKRKRKPVEDLRFDAAGELAVGSKRKERKKMRLQAMKKKHKKVEANYLPAVDVIKFGEVVKAPPKLITVPKAFKSAQNASKERLRLQAVENYRNRRGWTSRPGIQLPPPMAT